ncbi:MAG: hypothetical protein JWM34_5098 [Ilumatobacteraceae bacterium]|nr:hypothetical protein [Ilumatobacteraceae bacterium]
MDTNAVVLVEGESDQVALTALAVRQGLDLDASGIVIVAMGGATSIGHFLQLFGPAGFAVGIAGLCDAAEVRYFRRALQRAGMGESLDLNGMEALGFFVCDVDLEDELIRALGTARVESALAAEGDLRSFRIFQQQPAQVGRDAHAQLRRFMGTRSGRKGHYARVLVQMLEPDEVPRPLARLLAHVASTLA